MFEQLINHFNAAVGRNQDFYELLAAKDIDRVIAKMDSHHEAVADAAKDYDPKMHKVSFRGTKIIKNKAGKRVGSIEPWRLPITYPQYINEIALVFLYGRPVKWGCKSDDTERAFTAFTDLLDHLHFDSKVRQMKRYAGAYTQSAMLFRVFRKEEKVFANGKWTTRSAPDCQIRVLSHEKGDEIYSRWDQYENLLSAGWRYTTQDKEQTTEHFDLFLPERTYHCTRGKRGWEVVEEENIIGKIPVIMCRQQKEWAGVEPQIEREEYLHSHTADTNDYFADPMMLIKADIIKSLPEKEAMNKTIKVTGEDVDVSKAVSYLTWDSAPESKKAEISQLQNHILSKTFTPNIDFENMKSLSNVTGKALKQMMVLANVKAARHKEQHDELMERAGNLMKAIIGNVLDVSLKDECERMKLTHEFQDPFGEDVADVIDCLVKAVDGGIQSKESAIEQSPLTKDSNIEKKRVKKESDEDRAAQRDIFSQQAFVDDGTSEGSGSGEAA